ncbi:lcc2, laccase [Chaetomium sp. MPI-SDFR-AT-0129]|nr:lcc2, laccase [Chaetomium sp. MPI-SDFR-AT-0129]
MKPSFVSFLATAAGSWALSIPHEVAALVAPRQSTNCENGPNSRQCWGDYSIDTNYYDVVPETNVTREFWLNVEQGPCSPDGYDRTCMTFNGTVPGPTIIADWGDNLVIHVTNKMANNGTSIHWHGIRMLNNVLNDGVPGVTQCPFPEGETMTYRFRATQYGSTWYHSHFSLQYAEGLFGGLILRGPATGNYTEDKGVLFLQDWAHQESFAGWLTARQGAPLAADNGLINGTNTYDCSGSTDPKCAGQGKKFEMVFKQGERYLLRLINVAVDGVFQFSIDGHSLEVIAHDLVPVERYTTDSIQIAIGQRYDVIVEANAEPGNYWLRSGWIESCLANSNADGITGIVRYDASSTDEPTSESTVTVSKSCLGEPAANTIPHLKLNVENIGGGVVYEELGFHLPNSTARLEATDYFKWTINTSSLLLDWSDPTMAQIFNGDSIFPTDYNVVSVQPSGSDPEWTVLVIQDTSNFGIAHPIHLHGHDFWVLAQGTGTFDGDTSGFNVTNPSRRDVSTLPGNGYLAIAFKMDNPGAWLVHCHIAWHASEGLSLEIVEGQSSIAAGVDPTSRQQFDDVCAAWTGSTPVWPQDDSGI